MLRPLEQPNNIVMGLQLLCFVFCWFFVVVVVVNTLNGNKKYEFLNHGLFFQKGYGVYIFNIEYFNFQNVQFAQKATVCYLTLM